MFRIDKSVCMFKTIDQFQSQHKMRIFKVPVYWCCALLYDATSEGNTILFYSTTLISQLQFVATSQITILH